MKDSLLFFFDSLPQGRVNLAMLSSVPLVLVILVPKPLHLHPAWAPQDYLQTAV